jgi:hypothetical protein
MLMIARRFDDLHPSFASDRPGDCQSDALQLSLFLLDVMDRRNEGDEAPSRLLIS